MKLKSIVFAAIVTALSIFGTSQAEAQSGTRFGAGRGFHQAPVRERIIVRQRPMARRQVIIRQRPIVRERIIVRQRPVFRHRMVMRDRMAHRRFGRF